MIDTHDRFRRRPAQPQPLESAGFRFLRGLAEFSLAALLVASLLLSSGRAEAQARIKDIMNYEGVRDNLLIGYGLVVGLNGSGDLLRDSVFTRESLIGMLERLGVNARDDDLRTRNVAAAMVTATLPAFARQGTRLDIQVSALGNATDLRGGTLLVTPLVGADGEVYAVAQGVIGVSGVETLEENLELRGVPTSGRIANGAIVELEIPFRLEGRDSINLALKNPDFTTARRVSRAINNFIGDESALVRDSATVSLRIPPGFDGSLTDLLAEIEQLRISVDQPARVVIDEQAGIIVMGEDVRIETVAIAQGNLAIRITGDSLVSQRAPFANAGTADGQVAAAGGAALPGEATEDAAAAQRFQLGLLPRNVTIQELVAGMNALGVSPRDMISILQAVKAAGALQADIEVI